MYSPTDARGVAAIRTSILWLAEDVDEMPSKEGMKSWVACQIYHHFALLNAASDTVEGLRPDPLPLDTTKSNLLL
jgi:hypothetical protein